MKLIVVKNPNVARRFAEALNIRSREADYFEAEGFYITWVLDSGRDKALVFVPSCFSNNENRIEKIKSVLKNCSGIIVEANLLEDLDSFKKFCKNLNCSLPIQEIQCSSLTRKSIRKGLENSIDINDFDAFWNTQGSNQKAIVSQLKIFPEKLNDSKQYQIQLQFNKDFLNLNAYSNQIFSDNQSAEEVLSTILRKGNLPVDDVKYKNQIQQPPSLYNLAELINDCQNSYGFSGLETFTIAESLYENGFITYPNTEIKTIIKENWQEVNGIVRAISNKTSLELDLNQLKLGKFSKRIVNDNLSIGSEGIYPTGRIPSALNLKENIVYDLIALRFLESLSEPCVMKSMKVELNAVNHIFNLQVNQLIEAGWYAFQNSFYQDNVQIVSHLPELKQNETIKIMNSKICIKT